MDSTQRRMVGVAVAVCAFAVGMAGLLNYFKYRATASGIIEQRLSFTGRSIENSIQSSLSLGLQFADLTTLPAMLERERDTDELIIGIDIFDPEGRPLYSTDRLRGTRPAPAAWVQAARKAAGKGWMVQAKDEAAVGMALQNNFGLTLGHLALRYSEEQVRSNARAVARELALNSLGIFLLSATLASLALLAVMRRLGHEMGAVQAALGEGPAGGRAPALRGPFSQALRQFGETVREAETELTEARAQLHRGGGGS